MAGSEETNPSLNTKQLVGLIEEAGGNAIERDTLYNTIQDFKGYKWEEEAATY